MEFLIVYVEIGLLANFVAFILSILIAVYLILNLDMVELRKLGIITEQKREDFNYLVLVGYLIPFYELFLIIIKIILINRYYEKTADSIDYIIQEVEKHNLFRRKE